MTRPPVASPTPVNVVVESPTCVPLLTKLFPDLVENGQLRLRAGWELSGMLSVGQTLLLKYPMSATLLLLPAKQSDDVLASCKRVLGAAGTEWKLLTLPLSRLQTWTNRPALDTGVLRRQDRLFRRLYDYVENHLFARLEEDEEA